MSKKIIDKYTKMETQKKDTVTAIFPGIGPVEISKERAEQIRRLQKLIREQRALRKEKD